MDGNGWQVDGKWMWKWPFFSGYLHEFKYGPGSTRKIKYGPGSILKNQIRARLYFAPSPLLLLQLPPMAQLV